MAAALRAALNAVAHPRQRLAEWRSGSVVALIRVLPRVSGVGSAALAILVVVGAVLPVGLMVTTGWLLGSLPGAVRDGFDSTEGHRAIVAFAVLLGITVVLRVTDPVTTVLSSWLGRRLALHVTGMVVAAANRPVGIAHLEDPAMADHINLARGVSTGRFTPERAVPALAGIAEARLHAVTVALTLGWIVWWAPLPLVAVWVPVGRWVAAQMRTVLAGSEKDTAALRRATYLRAVGVEPAAAKDVRIFGLAGWALGRFTEAWLLGMGELFGRRRHRRGFAATTAALLAAYTVVLVPLTLATSRGDLTLATLVVAVQTSMSMSVFGPLGDTQWMLTSASAAIPHALALDAAVRDTAPGPATRPVEAATPVGPVPVTSGGPARPVERGLRFAGVGFGYPGRPDVLDGVDLWLPTGSSLALVGDNGAGKTTLTKLLARLYEPDRGSISLDGTDLRDLDPVEWRRQLAVVFQDFTRYELTARENVAFGWGDAVATDEVLDEVLDLAGGGDFVHRLPHGWDTVLSRRFTDGVDLSGGQWQRIALARALFAVRHGARFLVLDEPTAHLDIRAESELYDRFLELTRGVTTILISHRFATVRLADTICVLDAGRITETGSHDELTARGGQYARMFAIQSERFVGGVR